MRIQPYLLLKTGHRLLVAMLSVHPERATESKIAKLSRVHNGTVGREMSRLAVAGYATTSDAWHQLTAKGVDAAKAPCPPPAHVQRAAVTAKATKASEPPAPPSAATCEARLTPAEHAMLRYIAAHPGWTIAQIATGMERTVQPVRDTVNRLRLHGLLDMPPGTGADRAPRLTAEGKARAAAPDAPRPRNTITPRVFAYVAVTTAQMPILTALLLRDGAPMPLGDLAKAASMSTKAVEQHVVHLAREGFVAHPEDAPRKVALTEKGKRMASGDLNFAPPRSATPIPSHRLASSPTAPAASPPSLDALVPAALQARGGIRHPPIPAPGQRPKNVTPAQWQKDTTLDAVSPGGAW